MIRDTSDQDILITPENKGRFSRPWIWILVAIVAASVVFAYPRVLKWQATSISVDVEKLRFATVKRADLVRDIAVQGKVVAAVKPMMFSPAAGRVNLMVRAGDSVEKDQALARIDSPDLMSEHKQEISTLESLTSEVERQEIETRTKRLALKQKLDMAEMELIAARREMRRSTIAFDKHVISLQDHEKAIDDLHRADLEFANQKEENQLRSERLDLELKIRNHELTRQQLLVDELARKVRELSILSPVEAIGVPVELLIVLVAIESKAFVDPDRTPSLDGLWYVLAGLVPELGTSSRIIDDHAIVVSKPREVLRSAGCADRGGFIAEGFTVPNKIVAFIYREELRDSEDIISGKKDLCWRHDGLQRTWIRRVEENAGTDRKIPDTPTTI